MWRVEPSGGTLFLSLGARHVEAAVQVRGRWLGDSAVAFAIDPGPARDPVVAVLTHALSQVSAALQQWRETPRTDTVVLRELRVLVADCWLTWATLPWSESLADPATADAYVRAQLAAGGTPCDAADAVCVDDAAYGQPRAVARFPAGVTDDLERFAAGLGVALRSVCPLSVAAWTVAPRGGTPALAVLDEGLTAVVQGGRRLGEVIVRGPLSEVVEGDAPMRALQGLWNRLRARDPQFAALPGLAVLDLAQVVGHASLSEAALPDAALPAGLQCVTWPAQPLGAPSSRRLQLAALFASSTASRPSGLDAVAAAEARPWLRWAAAAAAAAALLGVAQAWQLARQVQATQAEWTALREAPAPVVRHAPWSREDLARVQAVNTAVRELNLPISALLAALQPPGDLRVAVLGVDVASGAPVVAGGSSSVKISAQARSGADMARYVAYVAQRRPFGSAYLVRHEIATEAPDRPYRFTVEAQWKD